MVSKRNKETYFIYFYQVLQINLHVILKNNICTYDPLVFREFQMFYARRS